MSSVCRPTGEKGHRDGGTSLPVALGCFHLQNREENVKRCTVPFPDPSYSTLFLRLIKFPKLQAVYSQVQGRDGESLTQSPFTQSE